MDDDGGRRRLHAAHIVREETTEEVVVEHRAKVPVVAFGDIGQGRRRRDRRDLLVAIDRAGGQRPYPQI